MVKILRYIWQLPQTLLAVILLLWLTKIARKSAKKEVYKGVRYYWIKDWCNGVSLGDYVLLGTVYHNPTGHTQEHEWGHTRQSLIFGPLYLLLIGLPSASGNLWSRIAHKGWSYKARSKWYYSLPWEHWADKLGGVTRWWQTKP